ncbi:ATP-binding protein [Streptomyces cucumeris]|uniref:ATP-binding protein n=1 Tax=Streptomyces cucumeris TaxID=2962890 RepID=UPI003D71D24D
MADQQEASVTLPSAPASVPAARAYVTDVLAEWGLGARAEAADTVRLIVSELATNAVQHTVGRSPTFTVDLRLDHTRRLEIGVTDSHPRWPVRPPAATQQDHGRDHGRGLVIIRSLAAESGGDVFITPTADGGKTVWIALPWTAGVN